jgi:hypothetical protein
MCWNARQVLWPNLTNGGNWPADVSFGDPMIRLTALVIATATLAACVSQPVPDSGPGVGFQDYGTYLRERERALNTGSPAPAAPGTPLGTQLSDTAAVVAPAAPSGGFSTDRIGAAIDAADGTETDVGAPLSGTTPLPGTTPLVTGAVAPQSGDRPRGDAPAGIAVQNGEVADAAISDENDFEAVAARETIESDKARIERNRAQYQNIPPAALPTRPAETGPNIVEFALSTNHAPGASVYRRSGNGNQDRACSKFASADLAQQAFLERGGPDRDRLGVDPDGDGFACGWDPRPFRTALR